MKKSIPILGFAAYSGTGKTTLLEQLIFLLKEKNYRLAVVKHDAHNFEIDKEGKDTWKFARAGADVTLISSASKTAMIEYRPRSFEENISMIHDVDLILVEGYKQEHIPRIGICRKETGKGLPGSPTDYIALVTDTPEIFSSYNVPCFGFSEVISITNFIIHYLKI